jgi:hypothetical protein
MDVAKTLAYYDTAIITAVKNFKVWPQSFLDSHNIQRAPLCINYRRNFLLLQRCSQQIGSIFSGEGGYSFPLQNHIYCEAWCLKSCLSKVFNSRLGHIGRHCMVTAWHTYDIF